MRIAHLTDVHLLEPRFRSPHRQLKTFERAVEQIAAAKPDFWTCGGDVGGFQIPHVATPAERNALMEGFLRLGEVAPGVIIPGNHDRPGEYDFLDHLDSDHEICFIAHPSSVELEEVNAVVHCMPWMSRSQFKGPDRRPVSEEEYAQRVADLLGSLGGDCRPGEFNVLLAHIAVDGAVLRAGQPHVPTRDPMMPPELLEPFDVCLLGHYHHHQQIGDNAWYGGSLFYNEYGEEGMKGWLLWEDGHGSLQLVEQPIKFAVDVVFEDGLKPYVSTRGEMLPEEHWSVSTFENQMPLLPWIGLSRLFKLTAHVRDRSAAEAELAVARVRAALGELENAHVTGPIWKVERVERSRDGAQEVQEARTTRGKIEAYWNNVHPRPKQRARVAALEILDEVELELEQSNA